MTKLPPFVMDSNGRVVYTITGDWPWEPITTPGAWRAKQLGCTCSRLDNDFGRGQPCEPQIGENDWVDTEFIITPRCPLHDCRVESVGNPENQRTDHPDAGAD